MNRRRIPQLGELNGVPLPTAEAGDAMKMCSRWEIAGDQGPTRLLDISFVDDDHQFGLSTDAAELHILSTISATPNTQPTSITCPECGMTSHNHNDVREGYCGNCHSWTATTTP
jgi:hypothetical protein